MKLSDCIQELDVISQKILQEMKAEEKEIAAEQNSFFSPCYSFFRTATSCIVKTYYACTVDLTGGVEKKMIPLGVALLKNLKETDDDYKQSAKQGLEHLSKSMEYYASKCIRSQTDKKLAADIITLCSKGLNSPELKGMDVGDDKEVGVEAALLPRPYMRNGGGD